MKLRQKTTPSVLKKKRAYDRSYKVYHNILTDQRNVNAGRIFTEIVSFYQLHQEISQEL